MKNLKFPTFLLAMLISLMACNDDEVAPVNNDNDIPDNKPGLFEMNLKVETPAAMKNSEDWHAAMAVGYVEPINAFTEFNAFFSPPEDGFRYEVISNKDKSGSAKQYFEGALDIEFQWDAAGNGSWKSYEEGEWTV